MSASELDEYMKRTYKMIEHKFSGGSVYRFSEVRPAIKCADGLTLSVQGSETHYSSPRENGGWFYEVEVGFPSKRVPELMKYAEDKKRPTQTVYGYVPTEVVQEVITKHGGIANMPEPENSHARPD